jgi:malonate transporter
VGGVLGGFATIAAVVALGVLVAHIKLVEVAGQRTLSLLAFYVASPALLVTVLAESDPAEVFSTHLVATVAGVGAAVLVIAAVAVRRKWDLGTTVVASLCSGYVNAGNLGIPVAAYALGDAALVAPVLLLQLLVLQPLALTLLDVDRNPGRMSARKILLRPLTNPLTVGTATGVLLALTDTSLPQPIQDPLALVGGMAVPAMLIAYGVALRLGPLPGRGVRPRALALVVGLKMVVQPLAAYVVGRLLLGMDGSDLFAVTLLASLPTAQNVFVVATRYERGVLLARDAIFVSTLCAAPAAVVIAALLA